MLNAVFILVVSLNGHPLMVPLQGQSVTVVGEVQYATSHVFERRLTVNDYIERSGGIALKADKNRICLLYTSPSPRDQRGSRMPSSA